MMTRVPHPTLHFISLLPLGTMRLGLVFQETARQTSRAIRRAAKFRPRCKIGGCWILRLTLLPVQASPRWWTRSQ